MAARRVGSGLILLALAGAWAAAAFLLWRSRVPSGLSLPDVEAQALFSPTELERARDYERFVRWNYLLSQLAVLAVFAAYARYGHRFMRESAAGRIGTGMLLAMLGLAILWLVQLPFGLAEHWWQRRHDVSFSSYGEWIVENWLGLGGQFLFICLAILIVMGLAGPLGNLWWIPGGVVFVGLATLFAFLLPYLIPSQRQLRDPILLGDARRFAREQGLEDAPPVRVQVVRSYTTAPNAEAAGLGPSERIILWDTLLDGRFGDDEVRFVLAHELGHISRNHIWKSVGWYALFAFPGAFVIAWATRRRGGMHEAEAVPLSLLVLVTLSFLALPLQNVITRHLEADADWMALETTEDPGAARALFHRFSTTALSDPSPPTWSYVLMETHPTIVQRIAFAEAWERERGGR
jgi:Zn-dependent protease with chaperone function